MTNTERTNPTIPSHNRDNARCVPERSGRRKTMGGFTLIEVIVSLILVGILAAVGGMAIVQAVQGYMAVRNNATITQKAELAMARITREIVDMTTLSTAATSTELPLRNVDHNITIGLNAGAVKVAIAPTGTVPTLSDGDKLVDNVQGLTLTYYSKDAGGNVVSAAGWPAPVPGTTSDIRNLIAVDVSLRIARPDGSGYLSFLNRVSPRNNKNQGGAAPSATPPTAPNYGFCFVATAAYGDAGHPMVVLLRDFRDRLLLTWGGGKWLVGKYYIHGPKAARLIQDRPAAMWAARCLLAPVAALTFFIFYAPWAFPFIFLMSALFTAAFFAAQRRKKESLRLSLSRQKGSVLIALIGTMVLMATLGAAMIPMFSASTLNQAYADQGRKAYFLAESGFRYAASRFLAASTPADKDAALDDIDDKTCTLLNNGGSFKTIVHPFWTVSQSGEGTDTLVTGLHGTIPDEFKTGTGGYFRVGSGNTFYAYTSRSGSGTAVTFSGLTPDAPADGQDILPVALPNSTGTVTNGGNLTLSGTGADAFPLLNGNFTLHPTPTGLTAGIVFNYEKRIGSTLTNITLADATKTWPADFTVTSGAVTETVTTKIILDRFVRIISTGSIGGSTREITYNVPIGWMYGGGGWEKKQHHDPFINDTGFFTAQGMGGHTVSGGAMNVTELVNPASSGSGLIDFLAGLLGWGSSSLWALNAWNWGTAETNLAQAWHDAGGCLSYDLQVKVNNTQPYWMAGVTFRLRNNSDDSDVHNYGLSFIRQRQTRGLLSNWNDEDDIDAALRPFTSYGSQECIATFWGICIQYARYSDPGIILWQRTGPSTGTGSFKVLAYKTITAADNLTTGTGVDLRLKPWSTLMVRLIEGYELPFTAGLVDADGKHLKYGDIIKNNDGTKTARIIGTPIVTTNWGAANTNVAAGTLILTNVPDTGFTGGESLYLEGSGTAYAVATANQAATKKNYIMVYYGSTDAGIGDTVQANATRIGNPRDSVHWPPDDWTDRASDNDYLTLVKWTKPATLTATYQFNAFNNNGLYNNASGYEVANIVDGDDNTYGRDNTDNHYVTLNGNTCAGTNLGTITRVTIAYRGTSNQNSITNMYQRFVPYFGGSTAGANYNQANSDFHAEGSPAWSQEFDITNDANAPASWSWSDVQNLDLRWITKRPTTTGNRRLNTYAVRITVTYTTIASTLDTTADSQGNVASFVNALSSTDFYQAVVRTSALVSPAWTSGDTPADFTPPGDHVALVTSSSAGTSTSYDDFAVQLDIKAGTGFLPPIQQ
ncbi:MAG: type II secretion system protein [Deltaproteobacteria bacterium]|nr:type II secretion system protein [Deltaproteobacteria bacterium]